MVQADLCAELLSPVHLSGLLQLQLLLLVLSLQTLLLWQQKKDKKTKHKEKHDNEKDFSKIIKIKQSIKKWRLT